MAEEVAHLRPNDESVTQTEPPHKAWGVELRRRSNQMTRPSQSAAVPAYFSAGGDWDRLIAGSPQAALAILNLEDGPGSQPDEAVAHQVAMVQASGTEMLGYVD